MLLIRYASSVDPDYPKIMHDNSRHVLIVGVDNGLDNDPSRELQSMEVDAGTHAILGPVLLQTIRSGDERSAIELLEKGVDPDAKDIYGSVFTQATRAGFVKLAMRLLKHDANPNVKNSSL